MERIYERLSLPGALGRVCPRLCEGSCRRCDYDHEGLAIGALHRYATDRNQAAETPMRPAAGRAERQARGDRRRGPRRAERRLLPAAAGSRLHALRRPPAPRRHAALRDPRVPPAACGARRRDRGHRAAGSLVPHEPSLGARLHPRRPAARPRRGLSRHRRAARDEPGLRGRGAGALGDRAPAPDGRGRAAEPRAARGRDRRRQHRDGLRPHARAASGPRSGCSTGARGAEMPCLLEEVEGAEAEGVAHRVPGDAGASRAERQRSRADADVPADGAGRARRLGSRSAGADSGSDVRDLAATP